MTDVANIVTQAEEIRAQLRRVHRLKGRNLTQAAARGRRVLPRAVRKDIGVLDDALGKLGHPKLEQTLELSAVQAAADRVSAHLGSIDLKERRRGRLLALAGLLAFNVIAVGVLFVIWMVWSGQL